MVKKIKGDLVLTEDTTFDESIEVEGNIKGFYNLKVAGDIDARNIVARNIVAGDIDARNIDAGNIDARNIDARNIVAGNIDAWNIIFCETVKLKGKFKGKIKAKAVIRKRFKLNLKEFESD